MDKASIGYIMILGVFFIFYFYRQYQYRRRIQEMVKILDDMMNGNENRKLYINPKEPIAPLILKINQLINSYQNNQIKSMRKEHARKQLLTHLSHDVRTPLTSVLGYIDALCSGIAGEEADEYLQIVKNKAYALKEYIDELFTIARIDAEEIQLVLESTDLFELLRSELIGWIPRLHTEEIDLEVQIPDDECFVMVDPHAIIRIFNNLLQNAVRYGGANQFVGVSAWSDSSFVNFEVWDQGPGLSADEISRVFDRLYKGDSSRSTKGHGLGLAIAKELVEKMNGNIVMESTPFTKTLVRVSLPKSKEK